MKICIDAGHEYYGGNRGVAAYGEREEIITFKLAEMLKKMFVNNNVDVIMTRPFMTTTLAISKSQSIDRRIEIANRSSCDLFISLHCGANHSIRHNGTETQVCCLDGEEEKIARIIQRHIVEKLGTSDRGVRVKNADLLNNIIAPSILIETAFITNENDAKLLRMNLGDFAQAIFDGVCEYFEMKTVGKEVVSEPEDIINRLRKIIEINDVQKATEELKKAKAANNSMYWMIYKFANR